MDGKLFKQIRILNGLSQSEMSSRLNVSRQLVSMVEINQRKITPSLADKVETEFGSDAIAQVQLLSKQIRRLRKGSG